MLVCSFWAGTKRKGVNGNGGRCPVLTARFRRFQLGCNQPAPSASTLRKVVEGMNGKPTRCGGAGVRYSMWGRK